MKIVTGYSWGIWWWRTSPTNIRVVDCVCGQQSLAGCRDGMAVLKAAGLEELRMAGVQRGIPRSVPVDIVVNERVGHAASSLCVRHPGRGEVASGTLCAIGDGVYVFTPAYCALQVAAIAVRRVAAEVDKRFAAVVIAKLGCELCGRYSIRQKGDAVKRRPLVSLGELATVALRESASHGASRLLATVPWIVENTRSPKETDVALLLCLPPELGGYGLPKPLSNFDLNVAGEPSGFFDGWDACNVDFYWGQTRLVVEYDSREHHEDMGAPKLRRDEDRAGALRNLGYTVVTISRNDLYSPRVFRQRAHEIAEVLQASLPAETAEFREANETLRMMLLRHDRWV